MKDNFNLFEQVGNLTRTFLGQARAFYVREFIDKFHTSDVPLSMFETDNNPTDENDTTDPNQINDTNTLDLDD